MLQTAEIKEIRAGQAIINEGEEGFDIFVIRQGSMVVEKTIGGKPVFLSYLPAGSYVGEMALIDGGRRTATVRAAIKSEVIKLDGEAFRRLLGAQARAARPLQAGHGVAPGAQRLHRGAQGRLRRRRRHVSLGRRLPGRERHRRGDRRAADRREALHRLRQLRAACADAHEGLSRLDREAGRTYAHLHVPTSCRHCEHPHCMADCPPNAINRGPDGEVFINDTCIGCGNCQRNCPYGVIRMAKVPPKKPSLLKWLFFGSGPGPGEADKKWTEKKGQRRDAQEGDQVRHVLGDQRRAGLRARLPDRGRDPGFAGRIPDSSEDGTKRAKASFRRQYEATGG